MQIKTLQTYATCAFVYGACRKIVQTHGIHFEVHNDKHEKIKIPLLFSQRLAVIGIGSVVSAIYMPMYAMYDLGRLEIAIRGADQTLYGYTPSISTFGLIFE